jgi:hypothetical protein
MYTADLPVVKKRFTTGTAMRTPYDKYVNANAMTQKYLNAGNLPKSKSGLNYNYVGQYSPIDRRSAFNPNVSNLTPFSPEASYSPIGARAVNRRSAFNLEYPSRPSFDPNGSNFPPFSPEASYSAIGARTVVAPSRSNEEWPVVIKNLTDLVQNCATAVEDLRKELQNVEKIKMKRDQDLKKTQEQLEIVQKNEQTKITQIDTLKHQLVKLKIEYRVTSKKNDPLRAKIMKLQQALRDEVLKKHRLIDTVFQN